MTVKLISITPRAEEIMAYCARVSSPQNQESPDFAKLLSYCIKHGHWSVFEQANMVLEITTSRGIAAQILRHRSFTFQEFSQRYASLSDGSLIQYEARRQDTKNRQNSIDDMSDETKEWFKTAQTEVWDLAYSKYEEALSKGVAKECARFLLPLNTQTKMYLNGTIRSWVHYITLRTANGTQLEHAQIAEQCKQIFSDNLPVTAKALGWA